MYRKHEKSIKIKVEINLLGNNKIVELINNHTITKTSPQQVMKNKKYIKLRIKLENKHRPRESNKNVKITQNI